MVVRIFVLLIAIFVFTTVQAQEGISFVHSLEEALVQAKKENKPIFMDAYTVWCGPCIKMNKEVFIKKEVGDFYNENFINVKMDMEKGEGIALTDKYMVFLYPTLLFLDKNGEEIHRVAGFRNAPQFLELGEKAKDPANSSASMEERYASGERKPDFLLEYATSLYESGKGGHETVIHEFLKTQDDWSQEINLKLIYKMVETVDSPLFAYLRDNQNQFEAYVPSNRIRGRIDELIYNNIYKLGANPELTDIEKIFKIAYPEKSEVLMDNYKMRHFVDTEQPAAFANAATEYVKKHKITDWSELNEIAWNFYEYVEDRKLLKKGLKIAKKSVKSEKNYYNLDTMASIYYRLNNKKKAIKIANQAIAIGKAAGDDVASTENLLKQINQL